MAVDTGTAGAGAAAAVAPAAVAPIVVRETRQDQDSFLQSMIVRHGSVEGALRHAVDDLYKQRVRRRKAEAVVEELGKKAAPAGAVILTGDDAKAYTEFLGLKVPLSDVKKRLENETKLQGDLVVAKREAVIVDAAKALGLQDKPLRRVISDKTEIELRDVEVRNEKKEIVKEKRPFVKVGDAWEPMDAWLAKELGEEFVATMKAKDEKGAQGQGQRQGDGMQVVRQKKTDGDGKGGKGAESSLSIPSTGRFVLPSQRTAEAAKK